MSKLWSGLLLLTSLTVTANEVFAPSDIPLLDNRFRIDYGVKEITFIVTRKPGTSSVILVRPDGSKLYVGKVTPPEVGWLALKDHDLIAIRDPMPGPWQAIGEVDPDNRVRILSNIKLETEQLPTQLYQGEVIKLKSWLLIDDAPPKDGYYLTDLGMTVKLQRFNDDTQQGEPILDEVLGHYLDDGKGLDEVPGDGVMTAEALLDVPAGKYRALYSTGNQVFSRARSQDVLVYPLPVNFTLTPPSQEVGARLSFLIDGDELDPASVVVKGKAMNTTNESLPFSAVATGFKVEVDLSALKAVGQYEVSATLFGTTRLGREIQVILPVKSFNIFPVQAAPPPVTPVASVAVPTQVKFEEKESSGWLIWLLGGAGILVVLLSGVGFILLQKRRAMKKAMAAHKAESEGAKPEAKLDLNLPEQ
ncbi:TPA: TIGR03503 family protein [Aeromonas salmonicida subsp. salmonicida]|uniref:TIGR03503 family protein n=1 Tax=Aeromonas salmonicida TaxID=645 RepID=UPI00131FE8D1|nr:TIGR03503 family protein [Aeromonas salmonicida]ELI6419092.1 TIGR03503 family protein [Aeromonas salmonicida subsp. salmonicida]ELM3648228.1 TIGR03503 family protein [Aeromonas salmonicida subsp. salmonicida]QHE45584.1 TIGR03503 family protein [Aeromonas salmonicida subsp. salmonicida]QHE47464.1 TIGR03503 family protein [Aeromonas salmonicida subsp. salmonicida]QJF55191.1 TIGR03503 family protein [Aeromonas salmonicida subsp. salmonicida]